MGALKYDIQIFYLYVLWVCCEHAMMLFVLTSTASNWPPAASSMGLETEWPCWQLYVEGDPDVFVALIPSYLKNISEKFRKYGTAFRIATMKTSPIWESGSVWKSRFPHLVLLQRMSWHLALPAGDVLAFGHATMKLLQSGSLGVSEKVGFRIWSCCSGCPGIWPCCSGCPGIWPCCRGCPGIWPCYHETSPIWESGSVWKSRFPPLVLLQRMSWHLACCRGCPGIWPFSFHNTLSLKLLLEMLRLLLVLPLPGAVATQDPLNPLTVRNLIGKVTHVVTPAVSAAICNLSAKFPHFWRIKTIRPPQVLCQWHPDTEKHLCITLQGPTH